MPGGGAERLTDRKGNPQQWPELGLPGESGNLLEGKVGGGSRSSWSAGALGRVGSSAQLVK